MQQYLLSLPPYPRGFHIITDRVVAAVGALPRVGLLHVFIKHTSAGLTINENADPTVLQDFNSFINKLVPESFPYKHDYEGPDDMPAHLKSALMGHSVTIPIRDGRLDLGTWQGIYLCEFRDHGGSRQLTITVQG